MCKLNYYLSLQDYTSLTFVLFVLKIRQTLIDFTECFCTEMSKHVTYSYSASNELQTVSSV